MGIRVDIVQSHRECNRDFFCNLNGNRNRNRRFSDGAVVGMGAAAGGILGLSVGMIKFKIPLDNRRKVRKYTFFREF